MKSKLLIIFILNACFSFAQVIQTELISKTPLVADRFIGVDEFENIYYIKDQILHKKTSQELLTYSNINLGNINSVNINNPFKIILLYKDYNSVVVLDNKLNELTNSITFPDANISLVSYASENNLWVYSKDNNILQLFDYQNKTINLATQPLGFYQENFMADNLFSNNENIWLFDQSGILQFNQYASFIDFYKIANIEKLFPYKKGFIYSQNDQLFFIDDGNTKLISVEFPQGNNEIAFNKGKIYIYNNGTLYLHKIL